MLFSEGMCFFKKPKPVPRAMQISAPIPTKYDVNAGVVPPYQRTYAVHTVGSVPLPPPKVYHTKEPLPAPGAGPPPGIFDNYWEFGNRTAPTTAARVHLPAAPNRRGVPPPLPPPPPPHRFEPPAPAPRKGSLARLGIGKGAKPRRESRPQRDPGDKRTLFRNAGLDERGRLKLDYVEIGEDGDEWETPDEYYSRSERKAAKRRGQWSDNY